MKILGFESNEKALVSMSSNEMMKLTGCKYDDDANKSVGMEMFYCSRFKSDTMKSVSELPEIFVSNLFIEARETLEAYAELKTKLESVRNQITTLTKRMEVLQPVE